MAAGSSHSTLEWAPRLKASLPASARLRSADVGVILRLPRATLRARAATRHELGLRAFAPGLFGRCRGLIPDGDGFFLIEEPVRGVRLDRAGSDARYMQLALSTWSLHCAGHTPGDIEVQRMMAGSDGLKLLSLPPAGEESRAATALAWARAFITGRRATAGMRVDKLAPLVQRVLGGESALPAMLRARLGMLPDVPAWAAATNAMFAAAQATDVPQILAAADSEQAAAIHALVCDAAAATGVAAGDGPAFVGKFRLIGPLAPAECERRLGRLSPGPTIAIVVGPAIDVARDLEHVGRIAPAVRVTARGLFEWLRPLGIQPSLVVEELVPVLEREPGTARRTLLALIERAGAVADDAGPRLHPGWVEHWRAISDARHALNVLEPDAARVAGLLSLSSGGLAAKAVAESNELKRGAQMLQDIGLARTEHGVLAAVPGARPPATAAGTRRAQLVWLAERDYLSPYDLPDLRDAWRMGLRLRAGDLAGWDDDGGEKLLTRLMEAREYQAALELLEAHAAAASGRGAGPPSMDVLYAAREMGMALWKPRRLRRLLRLWLRGYSGELRALTLAILAHTERQLGGVDGYMPVIAQCRELLKGLSRLPREQALIEAAHCTSYDDPELAEQLLAQVGANPARNAHYLCEARMLRIRAECEFVRIHIDQSYALVQQAREKLNARSPRLFRARVAADIEARQVICHSMLAFYRTDPQVALQPLRDLQAEHGCVDDLLRSAVVNDALMRMRIREVGLATPNEMDGVLAEARTDNLRGYLIAMFQLSENAIHRGECGLQRQISARIAALSPRGDGDQTVFAGWQRHDALNAALAGNWARARHHFAAARSWHIAEPWGTRTAILRRGEWGFVLMCAGRWAKAAAWFQQSFDKLEAMSASGRASPYLAGRMLCDMMLNRPHTPKHLKDLGDYQKLGYRVPRLLRPLIDAVGDVNVWPMVAERIEAVDAPPFWKCIALAFAAELARRARSGASQALAQAANVLLQPGWDVLRQWLTRVLPDERPIGALSGEAMAAILDMRLAADASSLAALARETLERASGSRAAVVLGPGPVGNTPLDEALERALLGEVVAEPGACALGLSSPFGAIAVQQGGSLPLLRAVAARLAELAELAQARESHAIRRRQGAESLSASWALLSGEPSLVSRLQHLRTLVCAQTRADDCELAVLRGRREVLGEGSLRRWEGEASAAVDAELQLRARIARGDATSLPEAVSRAAAALAQALAHAPERLRLELGRATEGEGLTVAGEHLGSSPASRRLHDDLRRMADIDLPLGIIGESGSGKDLCAEALHALSARASRPHVVVDCPTLRVETAASELFGHVRGAFTGATADHVGMLERAADGILQLDGIASLDGSIQAMLLRAFQSRTFLPVGGTSERRFTARIVVTSLQPLDALVKQKLLREDLAQRLMGVQLNIPPLRERGDDALDFAREMLQQLARQFNRRLKLAPSAEAFIREHNWPGNVRELRASVTRAAVLAEGELVGADAMKAEGAAGSQQALLLAGESDMNVSARLILGLLRQLGRGQPGAIARRLGLSRTTVSTCLSQLARDGLCRREGNGRSTAYLAL